MSESRKMIRSSVANVIGHITQLMAGFVIPPYVIHRIGIENYGIVIIVTSVVSFLNLLTFGTPNSMIRFISESIAKKNWDKSNKIFNCGALIYLVVGLVLFLISYCISCFPHLLVKTHETISLVTVRNVILVVGFSTSTVIVLSIGEVLFYVKENFLLLNTVKVLGSFLRIAAIVLFVALFKNIYSYVFANTLCLVILNIVIFLLALGLFPQLRISLKYVDTRILRKVIGYGLQVFLYGSSFLLYFQWYYLFTGRVFGLDVVTILNLSVLFSIAIRGVIISALAIIATTAAKKNALCQTDILRAIMNKSTRYALFVSILPSMFLIIFRQTIVNLWLGAGYAVVAKMVPLFIIAELFSISEAGGAQISLGTGRMRFLTYLNIAFGAGNVLLTVLAFLIFKLDILFIPLLYLAIMLIKSTVTQCYFSKTYKISLTTIYIKNFIPLVILSLVFLLIGYSVKELLQPETWPVLLVCLAIYASISLLLSFFFYFEKNDKSSLYGIFNDARNTLRRNCRSKVR